ncbi:hypothetical protein JGU66_18560 [Myxococcaceae bacterium JPH2]|nr:hypothetical protein [Myxococcaceae bacterium JPH2]
MRSLSAPELLGAWEAGHPHAGPGRALALLCAAFPDATPEALAELSVGERDALLLAVREGTFGAQLVGRVSCPACGERVELTLSVSALRVAPPEVVPEVLEVARGEYVVRFRLPDSRDLASLSGLDAGGARRRLLARCVSEAIREGHAVSVSELPAEVEVAVADAMERADPQARVELAVACPACRHAWTPMFDIGEFLWREVEAWAQRALHEVHVLARAYGWSEERILAMSPWKRQRYLEMVAR